jgi:exosome complex exonuclease RRP6
LNTVSPVSAIVRARTSELIQIIKEAKIAGATGPELRDILSQSSSGVKPILGTAPAGLGFQSPPPLQDEHQVKVARAEISQFWGSMLYNFAPSPTPEYSISASTEALRLALPLPSEPVMVSDVRARQSDKPAAMAVSSPKDNVNEIFTIKQFGAPKKRKLSPINAPGEGLNPTAGTGDSESGSSFNSAEDLSQDPLGKNREAFSLLQSVEPRAAAKNHRQPPNSTPFDYTTADSILHAKAVDGAGQYRPNQTRQFDPYAKLLNGPQGLRKSKKEVVRKSFTFRK